MSISQVRWQWKAFANTLHLRLNPEIIQNVARAKYKENSYVELLPCFRSDAVGLHHIAQALHSELHSGL